MEGLVDGPKVAVEGRDRTLTEWVDPSGALGSKFGPTAPLKRQIQPHSRPCARPKRTLGRAYTTLKCFSCACGPQGRRLGAEGRRHWGASLACDPCWGPFRGRYLPPGIDPWYRPLVSDPRYRQKKSPKTRTFPTCRSRGDQNLTPKIQISTFTGHPPGGGQTPLI